MTRCEISQLCRAWRCVYWVYWKVFKVSTYEAIELIQVVIGLCALDTKLSRRKLSFVMICYAQLIQLLMDYLC